MKTRLIWAGLAAAVIALAVAMALTGPSGPKTVTLGGATLQVEHYARGPERKYAVLRHSMLAEDRAILSTWDRDRHLHYFAQDAGGDYDVAFLDAAGKVLETGTLGRRSEEGITSKVEARHALFLKEGWLARHNVAAGTSAVLSPGVTGDAPEPMLKLDIAGSAVHAESASGEAERQRGLMHRPRMSADDGMLFIYPSEGDRNFWMRNTLIPLDIAFFTAKGELINVCPRDPAADPARDGEKINAPSDRPAQFILEVNKGWFERRGICDAAGKVLKPVTVDIPAAARRLASGGR